MYTYCVISMLAMIRQHVVGVDVVHGRDNPTIYPRAHWGPGSDITGTVANWNDNLPAREPRGSFFNYTELCPLTVGVTLRAVMGCTMSEFAEEHLWQPMGAEADATWCTDSKGCEYNCVNFQCRLRDWARLGHIVANKGECPHAILQLLLKDLLLTDCL